jgi:hypothetical protein
MAALLYSLPLLFDSNHRRVVFSPSCSFSAGLQIVGSSELESQPFLAVLVLQ